MTDLNTIPSTIQDVDTYDSIVSRINKMVENKVLTENQIRKFIDVIDLRILVTNNKLNPLFIDNVIRPMIENEFDDISDSINKITINEIYKLQKQLTK